VSAMVAATPDSSVYGTGWRAEGGDADRPRLGAASVSRTDTGIAA
jgi:hypothetical protein